MYHPLSYHVLYIRPSSLCPGWQVLCRFCFTAMKKPTASGRSDLPLSSGHGFRVWGSNYCCHRNDSIPDAAESGYDKENAGGFWLQVEWELLHATGHGCSSIPHSRIFTNQLRRCLTVSYYTGAFIIRDCFSWWNLMRKSLAWAVQIEKIYPVAIDKTVWISFSPLIAIVVFW